MEYLDSMVAGVGDGKLFEPIHGCALGRHELAGAGAARAERKVEHGAAPCDLLDSMVARVGDDHPGPAPLINRSRAAVKLPGAVAVGSDGGLQTIRANKVKRIQIIKILDSVVARVGDPYIAIFTQDAHGAFKLAGAVASRVRWRRARTGNGGAVAPLAEREGMGAVGIECLYTMVARVGDGEKILAALVGPRRRPELPVGGALRAEREGMGAVGMEHLDSMVARVGDDEHVVIADGNTRRRPELPVGGALRADLEQERAVGGEHLDSMVARVGDDERVIGV